MGQPRRRGAHPAALRRLAFSVLESLVNFDEAAEAAFECLVADPKTFTGKPNSPKLVAMPPPIVAASAAGSLVSNFYVTISTGAVDRR
jgi:hypothetical protein